MAATARPALGNDVHRLRKNVWRIIVPVAMVVAMAVGTKVVSINSSLGSGPAKFSPAAFGETQFPKVQAAIEKRAVPADVLAQALQANQAAAVTKYGVPVPGGAGPEMSVSFTGVAGAADLGGVYPVKVANVPTNLLIRVQTGPAINGTDLRDATGSITFGQFTNQIDYQNAASALNQQMKKAVLARVDTAHLTGKTVTVVGAFQLINPNGWLVTPVKLSAR